MTKKIKVPFLNAEFPVDTSCKSLENALNFGIKIAKVMAMDGSSNEVESLIAQRDMIHSVTEYLLDSLHLTKAQQAKLEKADFQEVMNVATAYMRAVQGQDEVQADSDPKNA